MSLRKQFIFTRVWEHQMHSQAVNSISVYLNMWSIWTICMIWIKRREREREQESIRARERWRERECAQRNEHWKQNSTHRAYANKHSNKQTPKQSKIIPTHFNLLIQFSVCSTRSCSHKTNIGWMHARLIVTITIHKNTPLIKPLERLANLTLF